MENLDIFNVNMDDFEAPAQSQSSNSTNLFKPDPNQAKDKVYSAVVRPVYWLANPDGFNPKRNFVEKKTFYLKNSADEGGYFDSPFSIGEKCEAMGAFFKLKREGKTNQRSEDLADEIKPKSSFFYLVYVEKDLVTPENEGKLMVWKCPIQVHKVIDGKVNLDAKAIKMGKKAEDIFNPLIGRSLEVNVGLKGGYWNYDGCEWQEKGELQFKGESFTTESKPEFLEFIKTGEELMKPYIYVPMDAERKSLLLSIITEKTGISFGTTAAPKREMQISGVVNKEADKSTPSASTESIDDVIDEVESGSALKNARPTSEPIAKEKTVEIESDENINNFLDDLDLDL